MRACIHQENYIYYLCILYQNIYLNKIVNNIKPKTQNKQYTSEMQIIKCTNN